MSRESDAEYVPGSPRSSSSLSDIDERMEKGLSLTTPHELQNPNTPVRTPPRDVTTQDTSPGGTLNCITVLIPGMESEGTTDGSPPTPGTSAKTSMAPPPKPTHANWKPKYTAMSKCEPCDRSGRKVLYACVDCSYPICKECAEAGNFDSKHFIDPSTVDWEPPAKKKPSPKKGTPKAASKATRSEGVSKSITPRKRRRSSLDTTPISLGNAELALAGAFSNQTSTEQVTERSLTRSIGQEQSYASPTPVVRAQYRTLAPSPQLPPIANAHILPRANRSPTARDYNDLYDVSPPLSQSRPATKKRKYPQALPPMSDILETRRPRDTAPTSLVDATPLHRNSNRSYDSEVDNLLPPCRNLVKAAENGLQLTTLESQANRRRERHLTSPTGESPWPSRTQGLPLLGMSTVVGDQDIEREAHEFSKNILRNAISELFYAHPMEPIEAYIRPQLERLWHNYLSHYDGVNRTEAAFKILRATAEKIAAVLGLAMPESWLYDWLCTVERDLRGGTFDMTV